MKITTEQFELFCDKNNVNFLIDGDGNAVPISFESDGVYFGGTGAMHMYDNPIEWEDDLLIFNRELGLVFTCGLAPVTFSF